MTVGGRPLGCAKTKKAELLVLARSALENDRSTVDHLLETTRTPSGASQILSAAPLRTIPAASTSQLPVWTTPECIST